MRKLRRTSLIAVGCVAILVGIGLSKKFQIDPGIWCLILALLLILFKSRNAVTVILVIVFGLSLGLWRGGIYVGKLGELKSLAAQKVTVAVTATSDSTYGKKSQMEFTAGNATLLGRHPQALAGNFKISGFGVPMVYRGDRIIVSGKIFPTRGSNQARMAYAQLQKVNQDASYINKLTRRFSAGMQNALPEPLASFGMGLLIGQKATLPQYTLAALSIAGLTHIIAVSGYNLTILVRATSKIKIFGSKFQKLVISLLLIGMFVLITGFSASIVRASAIAVLGLWAWYYGRKLRPILAITLVAAASGLYNPFYVWSDIGWYLSFTAFFGVLILAPLLARKILRQNEPKGILMILFETFSAYIMTLPLIMYIFGKVSVVALVSNLLVLPLIPFAMLFSAVAGIGGMIVPTFAGWIAIPAKIILTYILDVAYWLSDLSFAQALTYLSAWQMIAIYTILGACAAILAARHYRHGKTP